MPKCDTAWSRKETKRGSVLICAPTPAGNRWLPAWIVAKAQGGLAKNEPVAQGQAVFAAYYRGLGWRSAR
mgnify:FL=1